MRRAVVVLFLLIPGQQVHDPTDGIVYDASKNIAKVGSGFEAVEFGSLD